VIKTANAHILSLKFGVSYQNQQTQKNMFFFGVISVFSVKYYNFYISHFPAMLRHYN